MVGASFTWKRQNSESDDSNSQPRANSDGDNNGETLGPESSPTISPNQIQVGSQDLADISLIIRKVCVCVCF